MKTSKEFIDFNKEILIGEIGALIGIPIFSYITSLFTKNSTIISSSAVVGALVGAAVFWLSMRIYDEKKRGEYSVKNIVNDVAYFTPVAFVLSMIVYQPILFFVSYYLLNQGSSVLYSVIISQIIAFIFFLVGINIYRSLLLKYFGKRL